MRFITLLFIFCCLNLNAQEYSCRYFTVEDGLVQSFVQRIFQDSKGFMWFGTRGGISRYNGYEFENFSMSNGLLHNYIEDIAESPDSSVWVLTTRSIHRFDGNEITSYSFNDLNSVIHHKILKFISNNSFLYYQETIENEKYYYELRLFREGKFYNLSNVIRLVRGKQSNLLYNQDDNSFYYLNIYQNKYYLNKILESPEEIVKNYFSGLNYIHSRLVHEFYDFYLIEFENNYYYPKDKKLVSVSNKNNFIDIPEHNILKLLKFSNDTYLCFYENKILVYDKKNKICKPIKVKFDYTISYSFYFIDKEDNIWIGHEGGVIQVKSFAFYNFPHSINNNTLKNVWTILEDGKSNIWFSAYEYNLQKWDGNKFEIIKLPFENQISLKYYMGGIKSKNGCLYFPNYNNVVVFDGKDFSLMNKLPKNIYCIEAIYETNEGLLLGTEIGIIDRKDKKETKFWFKTNDSTNIRQITDIAKDKYNHYWFSSGFGVYVYDGKSKFWNIDSTGCLNYRNKKLYPPLSAVASVFGDYKGNIWLGNPNGIYFCNFDTIVLLNSKKLKGRVRDIIDIDSNRLLIAINGSLNILDLDKFYKQSPTYSKVDSFVKRYDKSNGFLGKEIILNGMYKDTKSNIWIACNDRVVRFTPSELKKSSKIRHLYIKSIKYADKTNIWHEIDIKDIDNHKQIHLEHTQNNIRVEFFALNYSNTENILYRHKLDGYEEKWSQPTKERFVGFTNLFPGNYHFKIQACNEDNTWSEQQAELKIKIAAAWYQTFYFKLIVSVFILGIVFFSVRLYYKLKENKREKKLETERQFLEMQLGTIRNLMDPHFTFNVLNTIGSIIYKENKGIAYDSLARFSKLLRDRLETSHQNVISLEKELELVKSYLALEKIRFRNMFFYTININPNVDLLCKVPKMIIQIFVENAIKHGLINKSTDRQLMISINLENNYMIIEIQDNGIGRAKANELNTSGTGKGTELAAQFFDLYNRNNTDKLSFDTIDLYHESGTAAGTKVVIRIPSDYYGV